MYFRHDTLQEIGIFFKCRYTQGVFFYEEKLYVFLFYFLFPELIYVIIKRHKSFFFMQKNDEYFKCRNVLAKVL